MLDKSSRTVHDAPTRPTCFFFRGSIPALGRPIKIRRDSNKNQSISILWLQLTLPEDLLLNVETPIGRNRPRVVFLHVVVHTEAN